MKLTPEASTLEERIRRLEDHLEIQNLISAYGPAADSCNMDEIMRMWHEDCVYDVGGIDYYEGHARLKQAYEIDFHQDIVKQGSAHACTRPHVVIEGDKATATHYGTLFTRKDGQFILLRLTASRWDLERFPGEGWRVMRRTNRLLDGAPEARQILTEVQQPPSKVTVGVSA
jgi:hypothetical protein